MNIVILFTCLLIGFPKFGVSQKVAIIGNGIGSALSSYFLHKIIPGIKIDIYNHQSKIHFLFDGILFNSHDKYLNDIIINQKKAQTRKNSESSSLIKDGDQCNSLDINEYVKSESLLSKLKEYIIQQRKIFKEIYIHQKNGRTFKTVRELLRSLSMDFEDYYVNETSENLLINKNPLIAANPGIQKYFKDTLAGHLSNTDAHGFAGLAFLMFSEIIEELQEVTDNRNDFIRSLLYKNDKIIKMDITQIIRNNNQNYIVPKVGNPMSYDFIILATSTTSDDQIKFKGFKDIVKLFKYRHAHLVYVSGRLTNKFIKISQDLVTIVDIQKNWMFMQVPYPKTTLYSIGGLKEPFESDISHYVKHPKIKRRYDEHAPPDYSNKDESLRNAKFELAEDLYNVHALHSLSMAEEMLAIGAKNISLLIKNRIQEIRTLFPDKWNSNSESGSSSNVVGQRINQIFDESLTNRETGSSSSVIGQRSNRTIDERIASGERASSSTVRQRTNQSGSKKSRGSKSNPSNSRNKF